MNKHLSKLFKFSFTLLLGSLSCLTLLAQQRTVTGKVMDPDGKPLPGVTIGIKGTNTNVATDANGAFSILVSSDQSVLKFSSAGFSYAETTVGTKKNVSVTLQRDTKQLEDVVVVGYGTQKKIHLTGAITVLDM